LLFTLIAGRPVHLAETANETLALACIQRARPIRAVACHLGACARIRECLWSKFQRTVIPLRTGTKLG
jgi:hypothetical protein